MVKKNLKRSSDIKDMDLVNSTVQEKKGARLYDEIEKLFAFASAEEFEDGMESEFSKKLVSIIKKHGKAAIEILEPVFIHEKKNAEIISEALRWIGRIEHRRTHSIRLQLLAQCLFSPSPQIRDGAALGLASMNDPEAIYSLQLAIRKESYVELREDMKQVLLQLEGNENAVDSTKNQEN